MNEVVRLDGVIPPPPREGWPGPVSLTVEEGAFVLMVTPPAVSVALVRMLVGLREPVEGRVTVLGVHPGRLDRWDAQKHRRRLGVGFHEPAGLVSNLTLRMNLVVPMLYSGLYDMPTAQAKAAEVLESCELGRWADTRPADVPSDLRRAAVMARAIVREPELLLLEEPIGPLRDDRADFLLRLCRQRARTAIMTTAEREGIQFDHADIVYFLDESGLYEKRKDEVGVG